MFIEMMEEGNKLTIINSNKISFMNYYDNSKTWKVVCTDGSYAIITSEEFEKNVRPRLVQYDNLIKREEFESKVNPEKNDNLVANKIEFKELVSIRDIESVKGSLGNLKSKDDKYKDWGK